MSKAWKILQRVHHGPAFDIPQTQKAPLPAFPYLLSRSLLRYSLSLLASRLKELKTGLIWQQWPPYQQYISFQEFCKVLSLTFQNVGEITLELLFLFCDKIPCQKRLVGGKGYSGSQPKGTGRQAGAVAEAGTRGSCPLAFAVRKPGAKNVGKQLSLFSHPSRSQAWVGHGASHVFPAPPKSASMIKMAFCRCLTFLLLQQSTMTKAAH